VDKIRLNREDIIRCEELQLDDADIVVCAYGQILTQPVLDIPPYQCVNVHFSLLPRQLSLGFLLVTRTRSSVTFHS
jgi:methionyl-tRNA formyltransferase